MSEMWFTRPTRRQNTFVASASDSLKSYLICVYHQKITDRDNRYFITDATDNTAIKATYGFVNRSLLFTTNCTYSAPDLCLSLRLFIVLNCVGCGGTVVFGWDCDRTLKLMGYGLTRGEEHTIF